MSQDFKKTLVKKWGLVAAIALIVLLGSGIVILTITNPNQRAIDDAKYLIDPFQELQEVYTDSNITHPIDTSSALETMSNLRPALITILQANLNSSLSGLESTVGDSCTNILTGICSINYTYDVNNPRSEVTILVLTSSESRVAGFFLETYGLTGKSLTESLGLPNRISIGNGWGGADEGVWYTYLDLALSFKAEDSDKDYLNHTDTDKINWIFWGDNLESASRQIYEFERQEIIRNAEANQ